MADRKSQTSLTSTPPLPDDVLDELVVQVRNQPTLYDTSHPNYGKTPARDECWDQIAENLEEVAGTRIPRKFWGQITLARRQRSNKTLVFFLFDRTSREGSEEKYRP